VRSRIVLLGLGANIPGAWGAPAQAVDRAVRRLGELGFVITARSRLYRTAPMGTRRQPGYVNAVVAGYAPWPPAQFLRMIKGLERAAGRRSGARWSARPLDIDILDYRGWRLGHRSGAARGRLALPHPGLDGRDFVLVPLTDVAPLRVQASTGRTLFSRIGGRRGQGAIEGTMPWPRQPDDPGANDVHRVFRMGRRIAVDLPRHLL
jgi:2-amino-4-hydroxy-6-hydroxymethyldihydropteridine diphosphokinase